MRLFVKICGVTDIGALAAAAGADAVGFVFHQNSPRNVTPKAAQALALLAPAALLKVAVTNGPSQNLVDAILAEFRPDIWQSDADDFNYLDLPPHVARLPVHRTGRDAPHSRFLFEGAVSGGGQTADWRAARDLARGRDLILAGGLNARNVAVAIAAVRPSGVDVSSGVEIEPGKKEPALIAEFIRTVRTAEGNAS